MKKTITLIIVLCLFIFNESHAQENFKWQAESSFHATAMNAFHSAEINKLQPARDSAAVILKKAEEWKNAAVPAGYNAAEIKPMLETLYNECQALSEAVAENKPDVQLKPLILKAHETFHQVINKTK